VSRPNEEPLVRGLRTGTVEHDSAAGLADVYAGYADQLAAMVEAEALRSACFHRQMANALGELHHALDELHARLRRETSGSPASNHVARAGSGDHVRACLAETTGARA